MSLPEKIAWINGILLATSEMLPLLGKNVTEATSLLTLAFKTLQSLKETPKRDKHRK